MARSESTVLCSKRRSGALISLPDGNADCSSCLIAALTGAERVVCVAVRFTAEILCPLA